MIILSFYVMALGFHGTLVSSSILTPLNDDGGLRIFKEPPNELEYVLKRRGMDMSEEPDSKERRSTSGSSFIRFGRGQSLVGLEDTVANAGPDGAKVSRHPRWKSPDIVIRFGRSNAKTGSPDQTYKRGRSDNFIRFGRNSRTLPGSASMPAICSEILSAEGRGGSFRTADELPSYLSRLVRLCDSLNNADGEHDASYGLDFANDARVDSSRE